MVGSYEDMMGSEQPVVSEHQATQHYAGDVVPINNNLYGNYAANRMESVHNRYQAERQGEQLPSAKVLPMTPVKKD